MATFVDRVKINAQGGNGGHGCVSIRREKYKPLAGPDGGNGGHGGSVIARVDPDASTLLTYHYRPHLKAESGTPGMGAMREGKNGENLYLDLPPGTAICSEDGEVLADLTNPGDEYVIARGGVGGLGNAALSSKKRKAPGFALLGEPGEEATVTLELKLIADVALVGFPSAGKSSLISVLSAARPKIADYPFTTLVPNLGVVEADEYRYTIADVPGLIPGASEGKGLGLDFLRHIERCAIIAHVVDMACLDPERDPVGDIKALERELELYQDALNQSGGAVSELPPLPKRARAIILNKIDVPDARDMVDLVRNELAADGTPIFEVSAVTKEGLRALAVGLGALVKQYALPDLPAAPQRPIITPPALRPKKSAGSDFLITAVQRDGETAYLLQGKQIERWVVQTDFANDEAVGYLADRLARAGVEDALVEAGAHPGDAIVIGNLETGVVFDWDPTLTAGAELLAARGQDERLQESTRPTRQERRDEYYRSMDAKAAARAELRAEREAGIWTDPED